MPVRIERNGVALRRRYFVGGPRPSPLPLGGALPLPHLSLCPRLGPVDSFRPPNRPRSENGARHGGRQARGGAAAAAAEEAGGGGGAVRPERVARGGRAAQLPGLPPLDVHRPHGRAALRGLLGGLLPARRRGPLRGRAGAPDLGAAAAARRAGAGLPHPGRRARLPLPLLAAPGRPPPPALHRPPPPRLGRGARRVHRAAQPLLPRPRLLPRALLPRRRRLQGLLVLGRRALPLALVERRRVRARGRLLGLPHRRLLHDLRALPGHLLPAGAAHGRLREGVRQVRRRRRRARAPPPDQGPAPQDQPPVPQVHNLLPRSRHRQPVLRPARHHQATRADQYRHRRRARALLSEPRGGAAGLPPQRGQDHAQDAGHHERGGGVARGRHHPRLRQRPGGPRPRPACRHRLLGAGQRLPGGPRRGVRRLPGRRRRRRRRRQERGLHRRLQARALPGQQHVLPEEAGTSELPGEQPGGHHGIRLRRRPDVAARALHDRVLARHVAAREDGRHILKALPFV